MGKVVLKRTINVIVKDPGVTGGHSLVTELERDMLRLLPPELALANGQKCERKKSQ